MSLRNFTVRIAPLLLLGALASGCASDEESATKDVRQVEVETVTAEQIMVPRLVQATGSLAADRTIRVSTRMMGWVRKLHVHEGESVAKGDLLVSIDDSDLQAKKRQAEAGLAEARAVLANAEKMAARFENLFAEQSVSRRQLDDVLTGRDRAAAGVHMAEAGLAELEVNLGYLTITSPTDGIVARRMVEEGDMANPGQPLLTLETDGAMKVVAHLGERDVASVQLGDTVEVDITSLPGASFTATIDRLVPAANPGSRTYDIEAALDDSDDRLRSGMFARVTLKVGERLAILAPTAALVERGQLKGVWIVDDDSRLHLRWVRTGRTFGDHTEVVAGLDGGETLALAGGPQLTEGDEAVIRHER